MHECLMNEGEHSWPLLDVVLHGGPICIFFHGLAMGIAAYVSIVALIAIRKDTPLQVARLAYISLLPLVLASLAVYISLFHIPTLDGRTHTIWEMAQMEPPRGLLGTHADALAFHRDSIANHVARIKLYFYAGWLWTALSLLLVRVGARRKAARIE